MASTHKSLRSSTANKRPTTAIADGQIALNTNAASPGLFFKDSTGATIIKVGPVHVGATAPNATPAAGGSSGNSTGEIWLDNSTTPVGVKIWNGSAWVNATPTGSTSVAGLLALASNAETQTGTNATKAVTPAGLQSKVSDSTSTTSSTTIASSTAVKSAYDLANAALPKAGGTVTGALEIGATGSLVFEGATADGFETTLGVVDPTADRTINLPNVNGTVITTGDNGTVTSTMIANGTIVDADISGSAEIAVSKLADGAARQVLQTDAAGTGVEWTDNIALPGTASATSFNPTGSSVPTNGFYLPTTNTVALSTNGTGRLFVDASGRVGAGAVNTAAMVNARLSFNGSIVAGYRTDSESLTSGIGDAYHYIANGATIGTGGAITNQYGYFAGSSLTTATSNYGFYSAIASGAGRYNFFANGTARNHFAGETSFIGSVGSPSCVITSAGLVGIGTSSPAAPLHVAGTSATPVVFESSDSQALINFRNSSTSDFYMGATSNNWNVQTSGTQRLSVTNTGNVGVANTSPGARLHVSGNNQVSNLLIDTAGTAFSVYNDASVGEIRLGSIDTVATNSKYLTFYTNPSGSSTGTERVRIDSSGTFRVKGAGTAGVNDAFAVNGSAPANSVQIDSSGRLLVGTSSSIQTLFSNYASCQFNATHSVQTASFSRFTDNVFGSDVDFLKSRNSTTGQHTILQNGDQISSLNFAGSDGSKFVHAATINVIVDGTPGTDEMPGRLAFYTTADGASSPTERMRITSAGNVLFDGNATLPGASTGSIAFSPATDNRRIIYCSSTSTTSRDLLLFFNPNGQVGSITTNASATAYNTSSDYRLKENVTPVTDGITRLQQLKPSRFNFIADPAKTVDGFLAHEVQTIVPEAITGEKDAVDDEGNPQYQGIDQSKIVPLLTAALQEAVAKIESLEARLTAAGL